MSFFATLLLIYYFTTNQKLFNTETKQIFQREIHDRLLFQISLRSSNEISPTFLLGASLNLDPFRCLEALGPIFNKLLEDIIQNMRFYAITQMDSVPWDVIIKTCDASGSGTDAATYMKLYFDNQNSYEIFFLDNPTKNDFERGESSHFKIHTTKTVITNVGLFWWPSFTYSEDWCVDWVMMLNSNKEICYEADFHRWILHYRDPPTYATRFVRHEFIKCVRPPPK